MFLVVFARLDGRVFFVAASIAYRPVRLKCAVTERVFRAWTPLAIAVSGITPACSLDVDECADAKPHCCMDPMGSYICGPCPHGILFFNFLADNIPFLNELSPNECGMNNGGCSPLVTCINTKYSERALEECRLVESILIAISRVHVIADAVLRATPKTE